MNKRCNNCGCLLHFTPRAGKVSLATSEQRREFVEFARANSYDDAKRKYAEFGFREGWFLNTKCPGCKDSVSWAKEYPQAEAETLAAEQNALLETSDAQHEIQNWKREVERRAQANARLFAELFVARFPHWRYCLEFFDPSNDKGEALIVQIPSENPAVEKPLGIYVTNGEVTDGWFMWHNHYFPWDFHNGLPVSQDYLSKAVDEIESLVTEQRVAVAFFRDGRLMAASCPLASEDIEWFGAGDLANDRAEVRSWRGTYDRILERPVS